MSGIRARVSGGLAVAGAIGAGAAAAVEPRFIAVAALLLFAALALLYPNSRWQLMPLAVLVISPSIFLDAAGNPVANGDAAQKSLLLVALVCLALTAGLRWSAIGAVALAACGLAVAVSILNVGGLIDVTGSMAMRAGLGYALPWLFLFVDWRRIGLVRGLSFLERLPLWCLVAGVALQIAGISTVLRIDEDSSVPRLQGGSIPAHLAMLALVGLAAGLCLLSMPGADRRRSTYVWVVLNLVIVIGTATRGPIALAMLMVLAFVVHAIGLNKRATRRARTAGWLISGIGAVALAVSAPELIRRSLGNGYEKGFNTSGRDQAWDFFYGLASQAPFTGRGLGFSTVAVELYLPPHVQKEFVAPHNEYIHLVLDGGLFFLIALLAAMMTLFYVAARAQHGTARWVIGAFGAGTLIYSYIDNTFSTPQFTVLVIVLLGLLSSYPSTSRAADPEPETRPEWLPAAAGAR